ncbi:ferrous iron transporter B [candidate division WOR-1 bacterium RIFOXYB2_FULL_42_35]|uniref:Ferrous iron transporter B n=1 Tax=candidate division WOR-1 bacterium RIFOXYC2_FULL_41_25 TaxID=1802586 RepID=A0A1F4TPK3_UNCSA|nr:MAG: ferrous iron transporter B [candidate division WOR-1 bacterium RIFOXYB2_FULL_42_35]OGC24589.1 MAG: ferrous iron transporter B [candidate division WOR-1 bacterium RIFOXYA2_FULL_41_14]OGC34635.1 MAG: ferrous iron transporter B [candidate division WOR-1 bacterium RIFOXYC2_FULL_41_25]OGC42087.1 MAG: ferrous iron transporter B [candidate division WOR-1 bacterium RIFOXYD2_FULL_41_8]
MKKVLLMGNPNVGKSAVFCRLTGVHVVTSNYAGTTVEFTKGYMLLGQEKAEVVDVPGTYSLEPTCKAEEVACEILKNATKELVREGDVVVNVVDATNLERNLYLTLELMEQNIPVIVVLNMWDDTKHRGISIDVEKLADWLGVPVVPTVAVTGEGFSKLITQIYKARTPMVRKHTLEERWEDIGKVVSQVQRLEHRHHTLLDIIQDLTIKPLTGLPIAAGFAYLAFKLIRFIGEGLITYVMQPLFDNFYTPLMMKFSLLLSSWPFWHDVLIGKLIGGEIDYFQSLGVLTTGLFVPLAAVLPYIVSFYFVLGFLEDSGYLPRLAVLLDNLMHKIGLHGFAIVPTLLGFGCNVPGILATRILESKRERFIASTLISIGIPCAALQAMIFGVLGKYGGGPVAIVYTTLLVTWIVLGFILNKAIPGFSPELLLEIPPYRLPPLNILGKKLWWRIKGFLLDAVPIMLVGVLIVNIITVLGLFESVANLSAPVVTGLFGLPKGAVTAIVIGFLRKDIAIGMLVPLQLSIKQLIVACVVLSMFFPCIATFTVLLKELGLKAMLKSMFVMITVVLVVGSLLNLIL